MKAADDEWRIWYMASFEAQAPRWQPIGVMDIVAEVGDRFHVSVKDILSQRRHQHTAMARQVAMYATRRLTPLSFPAIGVCFRRDHSTVHHAWKVIGARVQRDVQFSRTIEHLLACVRS